MIRFYLCCLLTICSLTLHAQKNDFTQTVRGTITDTQTLEAIEFATVVLFNNEKQYAGLTMEKGEFLLQNIPVGRYHFMATLVGYSGYTINNVLVYSGKETVLEIALEQKVTQLEEVIITPKVEKNRPISQMAAVSTRMLSMEEANRYAGSWGDLGRMTANFAGVAAADDSRNDIVIRGNSPTGVLWRLDGFDIPNPNHFGSMGGTGGPVGMLNNNQLSNSDFYTGAFPAQFGNATSGVFDLQMRNGNNQKREYMASIGFNGLEFGAEGFFFKNSKASYMINGRYSFLEIAQAIGTVFASTDGAIPKYKDLSAKVNIPLKRGNLSFVILMGTSSIKPESDMTDTLYWGPGDLGSKIFMKNEQLFAGMNYSFRFSSTTRLENRLSVQRFNADLSVDRVTFNNEETSIYYRGKNMETRPAWQSTLFHRFNMKNSLQAGIGADYFMTLLNDTFYHQKGVPTPFHDADKSSVLMKTFAQLQYRFNDNVSLIPGIHTQHYTLSKDISMEPRLGFKWNVNKALSFNAGSGLYSQLQPRQVYFFIDEEGGLPNEKLEMSRSWQSAAGFDWNLANALRVKTEVYYQYLYNIPVITDRPEEAILNLGDGYYNNWDYAFVNEGTGVNYGVDLTLEKFFENSYYILLTGSLYESKYTALDNIERDTRFNGNFTLNILGGYEFKIGNHSFLSINAKAAWLGGKRYLSIYTDEVGETQIEDTVDSYYTRRYPNYFKTDLNVGMKTNYKKYAVEWFFELGNITNHKNILMQYYNKNKERNIYTYQNGFMPMGGCRIFL